MKRSPSGDWVLPGGACVFLMVLLALSIAADALGGVAYVDPAGWKLEIVRERYEAELQDFRERDEIYCKLVFWQLREFNLAREMANTEGTYLEGWISVPPDAEAPSFSPMDRLSVIHEDGTRVEAIRLLFTESARRNKYVYDTSRYRISLDGPLAISQDEDDRYFVVLHFPLGSTSLDRISDVKMDMGGGDLSCRE